MRRGLDAVVTVIAYSVVLVPIAGALLFGLASLHDAYRPPVFTIDGMAEVLRHEMRERTDKDGRHRYVVAIAGITTAESTWEQELFGLSQPPIGARLPVRVVSLGGHRYALAPDAMRIAGLVLVPTTALALLLIAFIHLRPRGKSQALSVSESARQGRHGSSPDSDSGFGPSDIYFKHRDPWYRGAWSFVAVTAVLFVFGAIGILVDEMYIPPAIFAAIFGIGSAFLAFKLPTATSASLSRRDGRFSFQWRYLTHAQKVEGALSEITAVCVHGYLRRVRISKDQMADAQWSRDVMYLIETDRAEGGSCGVPGIVNSDSAERLARLIGCPIKATGIAESPSHAAPST